MEQVLRPNLTEYRRVGNMPVFLLLLFFIPEVTIRMHTFISVGGVPLAFAEPIFFLSFALLILDKWDLNKVFASSFSKYYFIFLAFGIWNLTMSVKYYHNGIGFAGSVFLNVFVYPLSFFLGYHYITEQKHLKNYLTMTRIIFFLYIPLTFIYHQLGVGEKAPYLQFFDHYEGWVVSFLIYFALSNYFIYKKVSWFDKFLAFGSAIMIILCNRRGIWISTFLTCFIIYYVSVRQISFGYIARILLWVGLGIGTYVLIVKVAPNNPVVEAVNSRVIQTIENFQNPTEFGDNSIAWRLLVVQASFKDFTEHPILGRGIGYQPTVVFPKGTDLWNEREGVAFHDIVIALLVTTGVLGLIMFFIMHLKFIFRFLIEKNEIKGEIKPYVASMFGMYAGALMWAFVANDMWSNANLVIIIYTLRGAVVKQLDKAIEEKKKLAAAEEAPQNLKLQAV